MLSNVVEMLLMHINQYYVDDIDLEHVQHIKDLDITFDVKLQFTY